MMAGRTTTFFPAKGREKLEERTLDKNESLTVDGGKVQARDDSEVVLRVQAGDEEASRELVRDLYPTIIRIVRSHLPKRMSEEDLAQTVYLKVFSKLHQYSGRVPLKHWVSRIAVNSCFNALRSERTRSELRMSDLSEEQDEIIQRLAMSDEDLPGCQRQSARELVHTILGQLKPEERLVINLLHIEEWSVEAISQKTGWSLSRIKVKAFRARQKMRKLLKALVADHQEEDPSFVWSGLVLPEVPSLS